jgi:riboflavin kinase/FMN adenylyltransferase
MRIFRNFEEARIIRNPVVTTGSFDGVHIGHKAILARLNMLAEKYDGESVLITFDPHPRKVLYPETAGKDLKLIYSQEEKLDLLEKAGLRNVIIVNFTIGFSKTTSEEFVKKYLHDILHARVVVVGFNHHFGFNKEGDYKHLWNWREKYEFEAEEIPEQEVYNETVSSTRIRQAISEGYIQRANAYLDHYYRITGPAEHFSTIAGFPELHQVGISEESKLIPVPGIYAISIGSVNGQSKGMAITVKEDSRTKVLVHSFDSKIQEGELDPTV